MSNDDDCYEVDETLMDEARMFTEFFCILNPDIDEGLAFPIVLDLLHDGLTEENFVDYAMQLLATAAAGTSRETH